MATWKTFEAMDTWKAGCRLVVDVHKATSHGEVARDYAFRDHLRKSALSIPSNIAEGFERQSPASFVTFLYYAKGSCGELRTQLYIAGRLGYIKREKVKELVDSGKTISRMLAGLIKYLKTKQKPEDA